MKGVFGFHWLSAVLICPHIFVSGGDFSLKGNEEIFVCGSEKSEAWREVPLSQAQYHLKVLFENEGYFNPSFKIVDKELHADLGPRSYVQEWTLKDFPPEIEQKRKRKVLGQPMTPEKLDEVESWLDAELKGQGYACPEMKSQAFIESGTFESNFLSGKKLKVRNIQRQGLENLDERALLRFEAFNEGDYYDHRKLQVTSNRILADGIAQSTYFTETCHPDGVDLVHHLQLGKPRIFRFGFGASTEELPFVDIWFKNARLDDFASSFWILTHISPIIQSLEFDSEIYTFPRARDLFFAPRARVAREHEEAYEIYTAKLGADVGRYWDWRGQRISASAGPTLNNLRTLRGFGPSLVNYLSIEGEMNLMGYLYELTLAKQFQSHQLNFKYKAQREGLGAPISVDQVSLRAKKLFNINNYSPALFIFGLRTELQATSSKNIPVADDLEQLPSEYRIFLGGERNLRGFQRQSINRRERGYLTSAYLGSEIRWVESLSWNLEPLLLWDYAQVGSSAWSLDPMRFQSYGLGLRWRSPLGPVRFTLAKGVVDQAELSSEFYIEESVFLFSFGREF